MGFNEAQVQAIQHTDGPCLVLAGPGSGKTLTIVNRVKYLIEKQKVRPEEILVVTFTRFGSGGDEIPPLFGYGQKRSSGYSGYISWNLLWNPEMGLPDESGKYSFGDRKISDFTWRD